MPSPDIREIRRGLKKYIPILREARDANKNEADTLMIVTKFLEDVLNYDVFKEISREFQVKDRYCDLALKIDGQPRALLEAKDLATVLHQKHIEQAEGYASKSGIQWVILTNAAQWHLYHLTFHESEGIDIVQVLLIDLLSETADDESLANQFATLHRDSVAAGELEVLWQKFSALGPGGLIKCLFRESVLSQIRREVRRETGVMIPLKDIVGALKNLLDKSILAELADIRIGRRKPPRRPREFNIKPEGVKTAESVQTPESVEQENSSDKDAKDEKKAGPSSSAPGKV